MPQSTFTPACNHPALNQNENCWRLASELDNAAFALETFLFSVQTGQFYREHPGKFDADGAIDQYLLDNLSAARDELIDRAHDDALDPLTAHAFLGRCLFTCYLLERGVIGPKQLKSVSAPMADKLHHVLRKVTSREAVTLLFKLFRLLDDDFNGSMFGGSFTAEQTSLRTRHVDVLIKLLSGFDFSENQPVFDFDLYDFRFIPIELISAIYEDFIAAGEKKAGAPKNQGKSKTVRRKAGAFYTPPRLAELVVDIATEGWLTLFDKRCLDPACGSGVFLVILFQRMAAEWCRDHPKVDNLTRATALRDILTTKLQGVDSDPTACMVACFSLYLAFLDQLKPRDIWKLKVALEKAGDEKVLPPLLFGRNCPVILAKNFFSADVDAAGKFDLVIGNPPWVGRNQSADEEDAKTPPDTAMRDWLFDDKRNPFLKDAPKQKSEREAQFFPEQQSAIAFMWKAPLHLAPDGHVCLLLPTRVVLSNSTNKFQAAWFSTFSVEAVWQFADYRHILFTGAKCPAMVVKCRATKPDKQTSEISYFTPKVERLDPRRAAIVVSADEQKLLPVSDLLAAASEDRAYMFWKMPFWGSDRDRRLLDRLRRLPTLGNIAGEPEDGKRWIKGEGFQPLSELDRRNIARAEAQGVKRERKVPWWDAKHRFLAGSNNRWGLLLQRDDCKEFGPVPDDLRRLPDRAVFTAPMVLVNRGFSRFAFSEFDVLFQDSIQSITLGKKKQQNGKKEEELLLFLTAVLNNPLASYYLFHTSANWGVERDKVHLGELLQLPFPLPEQTKQPVESYAIVSAIAALLRRAGDDLSVVDSSDQSRIAAPDNALGEVAELVYRYFGVTKWERLIIEDTVNLFEPSSTPQSPNTVIPIQQPSKPHHRSSYAEQLCETINRWARRSRYSLTPSLRLAKVEGLALLTLTKTTERALLLSCPEEQDASPLFRKLLARIARASVKKCPGGLTYLRGYAHFEDDCVHILKPLTRRHWTKTAALNDADELAVYMASMEPTG
ncbi:MAG: N-6 DNA methylase [Verrucomicrobia bacterium]|nr:N-6 DNA methylase [Verrucomicrobiota bacterium]